jgi:hypothetical protein
MINSETLEMKWLNRDMLFSVISGLIFLAVFYFGYKQIPDNFYQYRDDGIITMSHAKNLADYGTIGINPSGERVEGYSTPAQFIVYYTLYKCTGISFKTYSLLQTFLASFLLGFIFIKFFKTNYKVGLFLSLLSSLLLTRNPSFLGWHGSGMENAITHVLFLTAIYLLFKMYSEEKINYTFAFIIFFASIARIESIYYIFPLLFIFAISWYYKRKNLSALYFLLIVMGIWLTFNGLRYLYFGDFLPNTAYGQTISMSQKIKALFSLSTRYYLKTAAISNEIMKMHFGYLSLIALPLIFFIRKQKEYLFVTALLIVTVLTSCFTPFLFGRSRIDPTRTTTHLAVIIVVLLSLLISKLCQKRHTYWILPLFTGVLIIFSLLTAVKPYYLGWEMHYFNSIRKEFITLKEQHNINRPTVGNFDLGVMSWYKQFNIIDLGRLGNPVISRILKKRDDEMLADYIFDLTAPDFIELHDSPARQLHVLFEDKRFRELYTPVREVRSPWLEKYAQKYLLVMKGLWIRKDIKKDSISRERLFLDKLQENISIDVIKAELHHCSTLNSPNAYTYAARSLYRMIPELVEKGIYKDVIKLFKTSHASTFDVALLTGRQNPHWFKEIIAFLKQYKKR